MLRVSFLHPLAALLLLLTGVLAWLPALAPVTELDSAAASRWYQRGSVLVAAGVLALALLAPTRGTRWLALAAALVMLAVAPLRAEPVDQFRAGDDEVVWNASGADYGSGGGPIRIQLVDGELRGVQLLATLTLTRKDVGRAGCVDLDSGEWCAPGWNPRPPARTTPG